MLVTKTLLFVSTQRLDARGSHTPPPWVQWGDPDMDQKLIFVLDKATGQLLREIKLDGLTAAPPMTYMNGGKQYIVFAVGAGETTELVALSLPDRAGNRRPHWENLEGTSCA